jgi:hypothetical protein
MTMTARTRTTSVTQPSLTQVTAASVRTLAASGCRKISRTIQPSSRANFTAKMMPNGVR